VLYNVVDEHAEAFFARLGEEGAPVPAFVHREFERYLRCGRQEEGFVRVVCTVARAYDDEKQLWFDLDREGEDALTQLQGASIRYRIAVGPIAGRKTLRLHTPGAALEGPERGRLKPFTAERDGFSLNSRSRRRSLAQRPIAASWSACAATSTSTSPVARAAVQHCECSPSSPTRG